MGLTTTEITSESAGRPAAEFLHGDVSVGDVVYWRVRAENRIGTGAWSRTRRVEAISGYGVPSEGEPEVAALALGVPFPNPSSGDATVTVSLPASGRARLAVYDALGREVAAVWDGPMNAGRQPFSPTRRGCR